MEIIEADDDEGDDSDDDGRATLVSGETGERGAKRGLRRRRRIPTCSDGRAAPCAACCQRARRRRAAASRHPLTPIERTYLGGEHSRPLAATVTLSTPNWRDLRTTRSSHTLARSSSAKIEGPPRPPRAGRISTGDGGTMTSFFPLLPPYRRGESWRRQHTVDTTKTQGPRGHTVGTRRESPRTMTMIMI